MILRESPHGGSLFYSGREQQVTLADSYTNGITDKTVADTFTLSVNGMKALLR